MIGVEEAVGGHDGLTSSLRQQVDLLVVGGGPAGIASAIAAARAGVQTLLVEQYGFLGGVANVGLCLHTFHNSSGQRIVAGLPWESSPAEGGRWVHRACTHRKLAHVVNHSC